MKRKTNPRKQAHKLGWTETYHQVQETTRLTKGGQTVYHQRPEQENLEEVLMRMLTYRTAMLTEMLTGQT